MSNTPDDETKTDSEVLFPAGAQYQLRAGGTVHVMPWSIKTIGEVAQRMPDLIERAGKMHKDEEWTALIPQAMDEVAWLLDISVKEFSIGDAEKLLAEDFLGLSVVVFDECLAGPLAKIGALGARARAMMRIAGIQMGAGTDLELPSSS